MKIIAVIPARGGSKGIPRKNVRLMAGKPLISYAISCALASSYDIDVVVTSDDDEIKSIAKIYGAEIVDRPSELAGDAVTLDPVIYQAICAMEKSKGICYDVVITMQPTSPLLSVATLDGAIQEFVEKGFDTVISGINDPHLSWRVEDGKCVPNYEKRLNRQYMPKDLKETGAFVITKREFVTEGGRLGSNISVYEMPEKEAGDIDTPQDWWIAETELRKKNILIRVEGYSTIGMGHIYRGLQLAAGLIEHNVCFAVGSHSDMGIRKLEESHFLYQIVANDEEFYQLVEDFKADIVINDILNTSEEYMQMLKTKNVRIINFEDVGAGAYLADAVINALYEGEDFTGRVHYGSDYYLIRDEYLIREPKEFADQVEELLVLFGGTDPSNLTRKTLNALLPCLDDSKLHLTLILGLGYQKKDEIIEMVNGRKNIEVLQNVNVMSEYMGKADIAISSQGRTMLELAAMGVPTIILSQNEREATHEFGTIKNGYLNLGMGDEVNEDTISETVNWLIRCPQIRKNMREQMLKKDLVHGFKRVKNIILGEM